MASNPKFFHLLFILLLAIIFTSPSSSSSSPPQQSSLPPFLPTKNLTLFGSAHFVNNSISLTQQLNNCNGSRNPSNNSGVGRALFPHPVSFLDSSFKSTVSFSTRFSFTIVTSSPPCLPGDGIAFLITSESTNLPHSDGYIGLPQTPVSNGQDSSSFLAVEFDTNFNPGFGDINDNHVGIDLDSVISVASIDLRTQGIDLKGGKRITVWIDYRDPDKVIQVWVGYTQNKPKTPILKNHIDLNLSNIKEYMYVGFSASNGRGSAVCLLHDWSFKTLEALYPSPSPSPTIAPTPKFKQRFYL